LDRTMPQKDIIFLVGKTFLQTIIIYKYNP
jgi:hypothetical protein